MTWVHAPSPIHAYESLYITLRDTETRPWTRLLPTRMSNQIQEPSSIPFWTALLVNALGSTLRGPCGQRPVPQSSARFGINYVKALLSVAVSCWLQVCQFLTPCGEGTARSPRVLTLCSRYFVRHAFRRMFASNMCSCFDVLATFKVVLRVSERAVYLGLQERTCLLGKVIVSLASRGISHSFVASQGCVAVGLLALWAGYPRTLATGTSA